MPEKEGAIKKQEENSGGAGVGLLHGNRNEVGGVVAIKQVE
jgi:hypothetical protein